MSLRLLLLHQLKALQAAGYDVTGVSAAGTDVDAIEAAGVRHLGVPMTRAMDPLTDLRALFELWRLFRRERFTIVHTHTPKGGLIGQYAALFAGVPVRVHTIHGLYIPAHARGIVRRIYLAIEKLTMAFSHCNLSQNAEDVGLVTAEHLCHPDRIRFLGNGIDLAEFDSAKYPAKRVLAIRQKLGFDSDTIVIGVVARLVREKGYPELFRVAGRVGRQRRKVRFLCVGGLERDKVDALSEDAPKAYGAEGYVVLVGHRNDMADCYAAMDVFVLPSHREGFPRAPMEAAAMGLPVITTDIRGARDTVIDGVTGLLIPPRDEKALFDALVRLIDNRELRVRFGAAGRKLAEQEFDEQIVFRRVLDTYESLLADGKAARRQHA